MTTALPSATTATAATATEGDVKNFLSNLRAYLSGLFGDTGLPADARAALGITAATPRGAALYTSSGSWTVPAGVTTAEVEVVSGGGGGSDNYAGGHGASCRAVVSGLTPGASITITVGAGGAGASNSSVNGGSGGASSFGSYVTCTGGGGGGKSGGSAGADGSYSTSATVIGGRTDFVWSKRNSPTVSTAAQTFSLTSGYPAGSGGMSGDGGAGSGAVSGKIIIKW